MRSNEFSVSDIKCRKLLGFNKTVLQFYYSERAAKMAKVRGKFKKNKIGVADRRKFLTNIRPLQAFASVNMDRAFLYFMWYRKHGSLLIRKDLM